MVEQQVTGGDVLQLRDGADVAGRELRGLDVLLPLQDEYLADPFLPVRARVHEVHVAADGPVQDTKDVDPAGERIGDRLEHECRCLRVRNLHRLALLRRRGDPLDEEVEQRDRAEVLRRDAARDREHLAARHCVLERMGHFLDAQLLAVEVALHQGLVRLDHRIEQLLAVLLHLILQLRGDLGRPALALSAGIHVRAHVQQVDDSGQLVLGADRQVDGDALVGKLLAHRAERPEEVGALAVEHVHEEDTRQAALICARPLTRRLDLDAHHGADGEERALHDAERGNRVSLEAGVPRRVDQVDLAFLPVDVADRRCERHLPLLLVLVPVADRGTRFDRPQPIGRARLEEHRLDERSLARAAMADDRDVADLARFD